jgi:hypothetical protein
LGFNLDTKLSDTASGKQVKISMKALQWIESGFNDLNAIAAA